MTYSHELLNEKIKTTKLLNDWIDAPSDNFESEDKLREYLEERINECEVIYYSRAIQFLADNDCSVHDSLALAKDYGYTLADLDSEKLATLLLQDMLRSELAELDLSDCFVE